MKIVLLDAITSPTTELLGMCAVFIAVLPGAYLVLRQTTTIWEIKLANSEMDIAELAVLYALLAGVTDPVRKLSSVFSKLKRAGAWKQHKLQHKHPKRRRKLRKSQLVAKADEARLKALVPYL